MITQHRARTAILTLGIVAILALATTIIYVRWVRTNFHTVVAGEVYRSAQPSDEEITRWANQYDLRTIINLRSNRGYQREIDVAQAAGVEMLHLPIADRYLPKRLGLLEIMDAVENAPRPLLVHCRAGSDRAGVVSAMAAMAIGGANYDDARDQLSLRYFHVGGDPRAVEGVVIKYEEYCRRQLIGTGGWKEFRGWVEDHYSHSYYLIEIEAPARVELQTGQPARVDVTIHNKTDVTIPGSDPGRFAVAAYLGTSVNLVPDREFGPRTKLEVDIPPEGSVELQVVFWPPQEPGAYPLRLDLIEADVAWFAALGSPEAEFELVMVEPGESPP